MQLYHKDIAHHLTVLDSQMFMAIHPLEFANHLWNKDVKFKKNLDTMIENFNKVFFILQSLGKLLGRD